MTKPPGNTGVCVIRVWRQGDSLVVRLRGRDDVEEPATEWSGAAVEVDAAVALVRAFLLRLLPPIEEVAGRSEAR